MVSFSLLGCTDDLAQAVIEPQPSQPEVETAAECEASEMDTAVRCTDRYIIGHSLRQLYIFVRPHDRYGAKRRISLYL